MGKTFCDYQTLTIYYSERFTLKTKLAVAQTLTAYTGFNYFSRVFATRSKCLKVQLNIYRITRTVFNRGEKWTITPGGKMSDLISGGMMTNTIYIIKN